MKPKLELENIQENIRKVDSKLKILELQKENEDCYFVGPTGSGKSTLINILLNKDIQEGKKKGTIIVNDNGGPQIGSGKTSCTEGSQRFRDKQGNYFVDNAGFYQTKGPQSQITNAYTFCKMIMKGNKIKIIIVIDIDSLQGTKGQKFLSTFRMINEIFQGHSITKSCLLIISKVNCSQDTEQQIKQNLMEMTRRQKSLLIVKEILKLKNFFIFPYFSFISHKFGESLKDKIKKISPYLVTETIKKIPLTQNSKIEFRKIVDKVNDDFEVLVKQFNTSIQNQFKNQGSEKTLQNNLIKLHTARKLMTICFEEKGNIEKVTQKLQLVSKQLELPKLVTKKIQNNLKKIEFCKTIDKKIKFQQNMKQKFLAPINSRIGKIQKKLNNLESLKNINEIINKNIQEIDIQNYQQMKKLVGTNKSTSLQQNPNLNSFMNEYSENQKQKMRMTENLITDTSAYKRYVIIFEDKCSIM